MAQFLKYPDAIRPQQRAFEPTGARILVSQTLGHRILLPEDGELILGRFDPEYEHKPDIDLTAEDKLDGGISRRHARIIGWRGQYEIEDLESSYGTFVNEMRPEPGNKFPLMVGDQVRLGDCKFFFDRPPTIWKTPPSQNQCFVFVTFTGHYYAVPHQNTILIGRADPELGFMSDINLEDEDASLLVVSRRHVKLTLHDEQFMVEDMGSLFKTKLNGDTIYAGIKVPIHPGQHLWLGGYTLAFDMIERLDSLAA